MRINTQRGIAPIAILIIALLVIGGGGYGIKKGVEKRQEKKVQEEQTKAAEKEKMEKEEREQREKANIGRAIHVKLDEQNKSGQKGEATITQTGTSTVKVIVSITGKPSGVPQPAHIHLGSCPNPGAVKYPLTAVDKGAAQTELAMTLDQLLSELPLAVNVHKSAAEAQVYVACGDIEKKETGAMMEKGKEMMKQGEQMMQKKGDAMMQEGEKMMEKKGSEMMKNTESMMQKETVVAYGSQGFSPKTVTIKKGETVSWKNESGGGLWVASGVHPTHTLYSGTALTAHCPDNEGVAFDQCGAGNEYSFTFQKTGAWNYHDHLNASQGGTVIVTE